MTKDEQHRERGLSMFGFDRAVKYLEQRGITSADGHIMLTEALLSGELPAGTLPGGGWTIGAEDLEKWVDMQLH